MVEWRASLLMTKQVRPDIRPWTSLPGLEWRGLNPTERVKAILDAVACEKLPARKLRASLAEKRELLKHVYVDVSQNPVRRCFTNADGMSPCLTTGTKLYSFYRQGVLLPIELLLLQGHRRGLRVPEDVPQGSLKELAGEGFFLPCMATVLWSLHVAGCLVSGANNNQGANRR